PLSGRAHQDAPRAGPTLPTSVPPRILAGGQLREGAVRLDGHAQPGAGPLPPADPGRPPLPAGFPGRPRRRRPPGALPRPEPDLVKRHRETARLRVSSWHPAWNERKNPGWNPVRRRRGHAAEELEVLLSELL